LKRVPDDRVIAVEGNIGLLITEAQSWGNVIIIYNVEIPSKQIEVSFRGDFEVMTWNIYSGDTREL